MKVGDIIQVVRHKEFKDSHYDYMNEFVGKKAVILKVRSKNIFLVSLTFNDDSVLSLNELNMIPSYVSTLEQCQELIANQERISSLLAAE